MRPAKMNAPVGTEDIVGEADVPVRVDKTRIVGIIRPRRS